MSDDAKNIFVKDNVFDLRLLGMDLGADYDAHGNVRIGDTVECADGTRHDYTQFDRAREQLILNDDRVNPHWAPLLRLETHMTYDLGNLDSPLQLVCDTQASISSPQR